MHKFTITTVLLALYSASFFSCSDKLSDIACVKIPLNSSDTTTASFGDYFSITKCLQLEGSKDCQISFARKVEYFENEYYVLSSNGNIGLFVYDKNGKFVRQIGNKGNGRGEYTNIFDFAIDRKNRRILLLCNKKSYIKVFSLNGKYLEDKTLHETSLSDIACINGLTICPTNHQGFTMKETDSLFYVFDENFNLIKKHTFIPENSIGTTSFIPSNMKAYGEKFVFSDFHEHRTFLLDERGNIERCFKYEGNNLTSLDDQKNIKNFMDNVQKYSFILSSSILDNKCITFYKTGKETRISICKIDGERIVDTPIKSFPYFLGYDGEQALSAVSHSELNALGVKVQDNGSENADYYIIKYKLR